MGTKMWVKLAQIRENFEFLVNSCPKGQIDSYKIRLFQICSRHVKVRGRGFKNVGLQALKSPKFIVIGINLSQRGLSP